jgi:hypothetical protein
VRSGGPGRSRLGGSPTVLRRELADRGLDCSIRLLSRYLRTMQATGTLPTPGPEPPTTRTLVKWLMSPLDRLDEEQQRQLKAARQACPHLDALCGHIPRLRPDPDKPARRCKAPRLRTHVRHMNRRSKPLRHRKRRGFCVPACELKADPAPESQKIRSVRERSGNARTDSVHDLGQLPDFRVAECRAVRGALIGGPDPRKCVSPGHGPCRRVPSAVEAGRCGRRRVALSRASRLKCPGTVREQTRPGGCQW